MAWTTKNVDLLKVLWAEDCPTALIARALGREFTKNMVIGKAHRLKLPERDKSTVMRAWWAMHQAGKIPVRRELP